MIKLENTEIFGWEAAIRGCRNPMNSWNKSDTVWVNSDGDYRDICGNTGPYYGKGCDEMHFNEFEVGMHLGKADHDLMMKLAKAGSVEAKFRRMINVAVDITAPLYWWKEFDTYKVGTVANSCSTMHKIHAKEFTLDDFSCEHLFGMKDIQDGDGSIPFDRLIIYDAGKEDYGYKENDPRYEDEYYGDPGIYTWPKQILKIIISGLNFYREKFLETKDKKYWWQMIQLLPTSYNQRRTVQLNYEVLANIYPHRKNHKLDEWHDFCDWIEMLPYSELITLEEK